MRKIAVQLVGNRAETINISNVRLGYSSEELVAELQASGFLASAKLAVLQEHSVINLAKRLNPHLLTFEQAIRELEALVETEVELRSEANTGNDPFGHAVLERVIAKLNADDLDGAAEILEQALADCGKERRRERAESEEWTRWMRLSIVLLKKSIEVQTLRQDPSAVARLIELMVAAGVHPTGD
jgi:hypothetical protein